MRPVRQLAVAVLALVALQDPARAQPLPAGLEVSLLPRQQAFGAGVPLVLDFVMKNTTAAPITFLAWRTPFRGILENFLQVARGTQHIPYVGPLAKRSAPGPNDFITLQPGESRTATLDLGAYYAIFEAKPYSVAYDADARGLRLAAAAGPGPAPLAAAAPTAVRSNAASFLVLTGRVPTALVAAAAAPPSGFDQCDASQQTDIKAALPEADKIAAAALKALKDTPEDQQPNASRFKTWFGAHTTARYGKVRTNFERIRDALANKTIAFGCAGSECEPGIFAYVFANQPYKIFVCGAFWDAGLQGTDSRSGTIVHELSHFNVVAGTDDHAYGHRDAKELASDDPRRAIDNADNHEFFAENSPDLPM
jgi:peptidyl-Lys metalloendopeptidase